ncbi:MAG TPA: D-arabinono-1,4-lactone oxidase [Noviherbaspirillum sp.]
MSARSAGRRRFLKAGALAAGGGMAALRAGELLARAAPNADGLPASRLTVAWRNWSGLQQCAAQALAAPADEAAIAALLRESTGTIRCVGSGHSFSPLVPTDGTLLALDRLSGLVSADKAALTATVRGGTRINMLSRQLDAAGLGLRNLPDIDMQTLAGAISTGTHGTGAGLPALHADVVAMRIVTPQGETVACDERRHSDIFAAARVSLGSLGVITELTLRVVPAYNLYRQVRLRPLEELLPLVPELARAHRNFEFYYLPFTGYAAVITHDADDGKDVLMPASQDEDALRDLRRLRDWLGNMPQLRRWVAGKLIDRHQAEEAKNRSWRLLSTARRTRFNESECHVPRDAGIACVTEVIRALERRNDVFFPVEFRFVKGDDAWLSPFYRRDSCSIAVHAAHDEPWDYLVSDIGRIFRKHDGRPHWGKLHDFSARELAALYPRWKDFQEVRRRMDPHGRLLNPHLRALFGAA